MMKRIVVAFGMMAVVGLGSSAQAGIGDDMWALMAQVNAALDDSGAAYRLQVAEYLTAGDEAGQTLFFWDVGNKQNDEHFVPGDPRRGGFLDIAWLTDGTQVTANGVTAAETQAAIDRAMATWEDVRCSEIPLTNLGVAPFGLGVIEYLATGGSSGSPFVLGDITHAGFGALDFALDPLIIGVTYTFAFCDPCSPTTVFTDVDNNGKLDTAFSEIYYNNTYDWAIDPAPVPGPDPIDVESIVLHEAGHGLSQAHFGQLFRTDRNGKFHFAPRAVMNAGYTGPQQSLRKTDKAGHCSIWAAWPNK